MNFEQPSINEIQVAKELEVSAFNIRVYGILQNNKKQTLVSDEFIRGAFFTKFPGGGLEFGEGIKDCLIREFMEETKLIITVGKHIYTTDFFQISAFNNKHQIISVYYYVHSNETENLKTNKQKFNFKPEQIANKFACAETFRWIDWEELNTDTVNLPIDKVVVNLIKNS